LGQGGEKNKVWREEETRPITVPGHGSLNASQECLIKEVCAGVGRGPLRGKKRGKIKKKREERRTVD